ncbi:MAG: MFS transporter [Sinobacteraceae bacterium]|nr:MFS transporter [Nevskiaceae bacterium]
MKGLTRYQWLVIAAAWLGWGFDVFDAMLFNFVASNCIPTLLGLAHGTDEARAATVYWTGILSAVLLLGWAAGGVLFGWLADRHGRRLALMLTILAYALGTTLCAFATSIEQLTLFRALTSLGIGGEWAVGAALVAETVPEEHRVEAGALLQTASPLGIMLASAVNYQIAGVWLADDPQNSWRYVFLCGLAPVFLALAVRVFIKESERWQTSRGEAAPRLSVLFGPALRGATRAALLVSLTALLSWWAVNAFVPLLGGLLAGDVARAEALAPEAAQRLAEAWKSNASNAFNLGGLLGALAAIPLAKHWGRRPTFIAYFLWSTAAILLAFGLPLPPETRLAMLFVVGLGVYGVFSALVFYLPELFPTRVRGLASGFCYNIGRVIAAFGPFAVGAIAAGAGGSSAVITQTVVWVAAVPLVAALLATRWVVETRGRPLPE